MGAGIVKHYQRVQHWRYTCKKHNRHVDIPFYSTCSVWYVIGCTADHLHLETSPKVCRECDLYKNRQDVGFA